MRLSGTRRKSPLAPGSGIMWVADGHEKPTGYGDAAAVGGDPVHRGTTPGAGLRVVGRGGLGVRPRCNPAGDWSGPARGASQRTLPRGRTLAGRRVHRDRRLDTPAVRSITLRECERTRPAVLSARLPRET